MTFKDKEKEIKEYVKKHSFAIYFFENFMFLTMPHTSDAIKFNYQRQYNEKYKLIVTAFSNGLSK